MWKASKGRWWHIQTYKKKLKKIKLLKKIFKRFNVEAGYFINYKNVTSDIQTEANLN